MFNATDSEAIVRLVEVRAMVDNVRKTVKKVASIANLSAACCLHKETLFKSYSGRLKLCSHDHRHELVYYQQTQRQGVSCSLYKKTAITDPQALRSSLTSAFGIIASLEKYRKTYRVGSTAISLDEVCGLGHFVEIAVPINDHVSYSGAIKEVESVMAQLGLDLFQLLDCHYVDLLSARSEASDFNKFAEVM